LENSEGDLRMNITRRVESMQSDVNTNIDKTLKFGFKEIDNDANTMCCADSGSPIAVKASTYSPFEEALKKAILQKILELKRDGTISMSVENLKQVVRPPSQFLDGAPKGTNARYYYSVMFEDICDGLSFCRNASSKIATNPSMDQFCGKPDAHGLNKPLGGGFSVMEDLAYRLHDEANDFADVNPRIASLKAGLKEIAHDYDPRTCTSCEATKFIAKTLNATSGNEPPAQRSVSEENAPTSLKTRKADWIGARPVECDFCHEIIKDEWFVDGATRFGPWAIMCPECFAKNGRGIGPGRGQKYDARSGRKLEGSDKKVATGEMSMEDIRSGGEYYEWAKRIERAARQLQRVTNGKVVFNEMRPFDVYQGPYARMSPGKLWSGSEEGSFYYESMGEDFSGEIHEIAQAYLASLKDASDKKASCDCGALNLDGLRSRRAMYWCAPDRTFKLTKQEQDSGSVVCPKCRTEMSKEPFTRTEKLLMCPSCGLKVPTSKAVTNIEVKVPEGVNVQVIKTDDTGEETSGENIIGSGKSRRGRLNKVADVDLSSLPRMSLSQIADVVYGDWKPVNYSAKPYLEAMSTLRDVNDFYGQDSGHSIVAYFLSNSSGWRSEVSRAVKKELQRRIR